MRVSKQEPVAVVMNTDLPFFLDRPAILERTIASRCCRGDWANFCGTKKFEMRPASRHGPGISAARARVHLNDARTPPTSARSVRDHGANCPVAEARR